MPNVMALISMCIIIPQNDPILRHQQLKGLIARHFTLKHLTMNYFVKYIAAFRILEALVFCAALQ